MLGSGKVKVLAIVDNVPLKSLPGVPTVFKDVPHYNLNKGWSGLFGPAGLPESIALRLQKELNKALHAPEVVAKLDALGMLPVGSPPEDFETLFHTSLEKTRAIVNRLKLEPQ